MDAVVVELMITNDYSEWKQYVEEFGCDFMEEANDCWRTSCSEAVSRSHTLKLLAGKISCYFRNRFNFVVITFCKWAPQWRKGLRCS